MNRQLMIPGNLVKKDNSLIRLTIGLGNVLCNRILATLISCISTKDTDFQPVYEISVASIFPRNAEISGKLYKDVATACNELLGCKLILEYGSVVNPEWEGMPFFVKIHYQNGVITAEFNRHCTPLLIQLKKNFTMYNLAEYCTLRSPYTQKLFENLKSYEQLGEVTLTLEHLYEILGLKKTLRIYANFKKFILLPAQKDIHEKTSFRFDFEPIKESRRYTKIKFILGTARKKIEVHQTTQQNLQQVNQIVSELAQEKRINAPHSESTEEAPMSENYEAMRKLKSALAQKLGDSVYKIWISPLLGNLSNGTLTLLAPSKYFAEYVNEHYSNIIENTATELFGETKVVIKSRDDIETI